MKKLFVLFTSLTAFFLHGGEISVAACNEMLGLNIFAARDTWNFTQMRSRLGIRLSGNTGRFSARLNRQVAGVTAVELIVYTTNNDRSVSRITIIYANKGDTTSRTRSQIRNAERQVKERIDAKLGASRRNNFSIGSLRVRADFWQCRFAKFYLETDKGEFAMLHITPVNAPEGRERVGDRNFADNVRRNDFGDVLIANIPMVNQGGKGYCVPATLERVFLYYGITMDMHHLADIGGTDPDEGTYTDRMMDDIASLRRRAGLRSTDISSLSIRAIARHIDRGYPVVWQMYSTSELNGVYSFSQRNRSNAASAQEWKRALRRVDIPRSTEGPHVCLIIGYNRETDEIAVSNSWGQAFAVRWIPLKVARKVSRQLLVLYP